MLGHAEYDPRNPQTAEQIREELDPRLIPLYDYCEENNVIVPNQLKHAPSNVLMLFEDHRLRPQIWKFVYWRWSQQLEVPAEGPRIYADEQE